MSDLVADLASAERHVLIAPAGHGKSRAIAEAATRSEGPQLILTHTHAGLRSLRRHIAIAGADPDQVTLETIAGFSRRWASAYPEIAEWDPGTPVPIWDGLYPAAQRVLRRPQLLEALARSYSGLFVDEYQDCTVEQHEIVLQLAAVLPTRVLGDPLQGIFSFGSSPIVDFDAHVLSVFKLLDQPTIPWRWQASNPALGEDLLRLRDELLGGHRIDLATFPTFDVVNGTHPAAAVATCQRVAERDGSVVAIRAQPRQAHALASKLRGTYASMEEAEGRDIISAAQRIEACTGPTRAATVMDVIGGCTTKVVPALRAVYDSFASGALPAIPRGGNRPAVEALVAVAEDESTRRLALAIATLCSYPDIVVFRPEIPRDLIEAARLHSLAACPSLVEAAVAVRDRGRREGRRLPRRTVSRTLLVKGLEFDHAVVLDAKEYDAKHLYVALTRGSRSVTVVQA